MSYIKDTKELGAYPVSIALAGVAVILIFSKSSINETLLKVLILILSFIFLTVFNTLYFKWFKRKKKLNRNSFSD